MELVSADRTLVRVTDQPPSVDEALAAVADPSAGGTCVFIGTVRDHSTTGPEVTDLTYEAWDELATQRLTEIGAQLHERWSICRAALLHATGTLHVGAGQRGRCGFRAAPGPGRSRPAGSASRS